MNDTTMFLASGKRLSMDLKVHGIGILKASVSYETSKDDPLDNHYLVEHIVPQVVAALHTSSDSDVRDQADAFALSVRKLCDAGRKELVLNEFLLLSIRLAALNN